MARMKTGRAEGLAAQNAALRKQIALLQDAIEHMHQGLCMYDGDGRVAVCNRRYAEILRLPPDSIQPGITAAEIVQLGIDAGHYPPDMTISRIRRDIRAQLADSAGRPTMIRDDRTYAVRSIGTADGYSVSTCEDITGEVEAERALRDSESRLRAILEAMPDCVKIFEESGRIVHINPKGLELLQAPDLESLSRPGYTPVPPEYLERCIDVHARVIAGEPVMWTYEVVGLEGRRRHVEAHSVPFRMPDGARAHLCITRDVNERKESDDALRRGEERLRLVHEATGLADFESGPDGLMVCSDRFFEQLGLPTGEGKVDAKAWAEQIHPQDRDRIVEQIEAAVAARRETFGAEFRIVRADNGETRWIACSTRMQYADDGTLLRTIGAHLDITERKRAEEALRASEERLRLVHEATGLGDFEAGPDGVTTFSERFMKQVGLPPDTTNLTYDEWLRIVHPDDRARLASDIAAALAAKEAFQCEFRIVRPDTGEIRWISSRTKMERDEAGRAIRSIGAHLDITEQRAAEEDLRESEERFRLAAEAAGIGVWDYDAAADRREWSGRLRQIFGIPEEAEASVELARSCVHPIDRARFTRRLSGLADGKAERFADTFRIRRQGDDAERWVAVNGWRTRKASSGHYRIIMTMRDVTDEKTAEERVRWSASHDALTRLANRGLFQEKLDNAIREAASEGGAVGLILLDMDHFKQVNDTLGHDVGDKLLKMFADRLRGVVRSEDTVARFGGDEFAIVMPGLDSEQSLIELTESIQDRMREPYIHGGRILDCRASMGASMFPVHGRRIEELLKNADIALYAAKAAGRATVNIYEPRMREDVQKRLSMVQLARNAIRDDRVVPYYQPKLALADGSVIGFEALLRWRTPTGRMGSPGALEAAFEDIEVASALSDRMIERVIADMRGWLDKGVAFQHVAVNASAAEFRRDSFAERVLERLRRAKVPTRCFQLEVTETVFLGRGAESVHRALALLSSHGVKIALDDFGTGYASLRHLKQFPVDTMKIDQSFVRDMEADPGDEAIIRAVINLGRSLGIKVVAEGIETDSQAKRLIELGCDFGQGFLFSKAVAERAVPALVGYRPRSAAGASKTSNGKLRLVSDRR